MVLVQFDKQPENLGRHASIHLQINVTVAIIIL